MKRIGYDHDIDIANVKIFGEFQLNDPRVPRHRCVLCKKPVSIDDSFSCCGHLLICSPCLYEYFDGDILAADKWRKEEAESKRKIAADIVELFEDLLDDKGIEIPCADPDEEVERHNDGNTARLYGTEFWDLVNRIEEILK